MTLAGLVVAGLAAARLAAADLWADFALAAAAAAAVGAAAVGVDSNPGAAGCSVRMRTSTGQVAATYFSTSSETKVG